MITSSSFKHLIAHIIRWASNISKVFASSKLLWNETISISQKQSEKSFSTFIKSLNVAIFRLLRGKGKISIRGVRAYHTYSYPYASNYKFLGGKRFSLFPAFFLHTLAIYDRNSWGSEKRRKLNLLRHSMRFGFPFRLRTTFCNSLSGASYLTSIWILLCCRSQNWEEEIVEAAGKFDGLGAIERHRPNCPAGKTNSISVIIFFDAES